MKQIIRWVVMGVIVLLIAAQAVRPSRNVPRGGVAHPVTELYPLPPDIDSVFRAACYDCHSDSTRYPWYASVQPVGWWLNNHIEEGKKRLNFSEFSSYRLRRQFGKFKDIASEIAEGGMPLGSYLIVHTDAKLTQAQKDRIASWAEAMMDTMKARYPADSLKTRRQ
jgi:hypothetical protein